MKGRWENEILLEDEILAVQSAGFETPDIL